MKVDLEVLEQRVFRERLWKQDLQFVWIRWFMDYPDPHNEYFDTFYGKKTTGRRQAWVNDAFDKELEAGRDTRDPKKRLEAYKKAEEIMQQDVGYVPVAWVVRYAAAKPWVKGIEKNKAGEFVVDGNIYVEHARAHLHGREGIGAQAAEKGPAARRRPKAGREAYSLYVERPVEGANEADGPLSAVCEAAVSGFRLGRQQGEVAVDAAPAAVPTGEDEGRRGPAA